MKPKADAAARDGLFPQNREVLSDQDTAAFSTVSKSDLAFFSDSSEPITTMESDASNTVAGSISVMFRLLRRIISAVSPYVLLSSLSNTDLPTSCDPAFRLNVSILATGDSKVKGDWIL